MNQTQLTIELPPSLKTQLAKKAKQVGLPIVDYVKKLIQQDLTEPDYPTFEASASTIRAGKRAIRDRDKSTLIKTPEELDRFFEEL